ncbi:MAG: S41 family peptidase [bacterium]|nr:S41 family peptidase [bacterium]
MRAIAASIGLVLVLIFSGCAALSVNTNKRGAKDSTVNVPISENPFEEQWKIIVNNFVRSIPDTPEEKRVCFEKILAKGLSHCLNDTNSSYLTKEAYATLQEQVQGSFGGIGLRFNNTQKHIIIEEVIERMPAALSGKFEQGDMIVEVDGQDVTDIPLTEVVRKIRGTIGTPVVIRFQRNGVVQEAVTLTRAKIIVPSVIAQDLDSKITHVRINEFTAHTAKQFFKEVATRLLVNVPDGRTIFDPTLRKFIYDIRGNPGGLLSSVVEIARFFSNDPAHIIVIQQSYDDIYVVRVGNMTLSNSKDVAGILHDVKAVILINDTSASAAEIFAAFAHEAAHIPRVGKQTYGKGSVQAFFPLEAGDALKLTVFKYFVGNGKIDIDGIGIQPEYEVDNPEQVSGQADLKQDLQLQKAIELLTATK